MTLPGNQEHEKEAVEEQVSARVILQFPIPLSSAPKHALIFSMFNSRYVTFKSVYQTYISKRVVLQDKPTASQTDKIM